jgi:hypothetical protein
LKDIVQAAHLRSSELVKEVCDREGAAEVVRVVNELVATRTGRYGEALIFLHFGDDLPELQEAMARSELGSTLEEMLRTGPFWDRSTAIFALRFVSPRWREALASAARRCEEERDLLTLVRIFSALGDGEHCDVPNVIAKLRTSPDWLVRWTVITWTSLCLDSDLADEVRRALASDPCRWIAEEARHQVAWVESYRATFKQDVFLGPFPEDAVFELRYAGTVAVATSRMDDDPPRSFDALSDLFVHSWPRDKRDYTLEELRGFFEEVLGRADSA